MLKQELSGFQVTTFFRKNNCGNIEGMKVKFFFKMLKSLCRSPKCKKKIEKKYFVLKINALEVLAGISLSYDKNTCDQPKTC